MISANLLAIFYLISGILFILALRGLSSPETSRQGKLYVILGRIIAVTLTFLSIGKFSNVFILLLIHKFRQQKSQAVKIYCLTKIYYLGSDLPSQRDCHSFKIRARLFAANSKSFGIIASINPSGKCSTGFATPGQATTA